MTNDEALLIAEEKMQKSEEHLVHEFAGVRTGKASPALVENLQVEAYGSQMRLRDMAGITVPEPRQLLIQPWDMSVIVHIEKAIQRSNLGLNPMTEGKSIRLIMPELSEERRKEFQKVAKKMAEDARVAVRQVRREAIENLKKANKAGEITEDDLSLGEKDIQKLTDRFTGKIDEHLAKKEKEIMTV